jgi:hypothetical protein
MPEGEARWIADPTRRHELRWWNGTRWTEHVRDQDVVAEDWGPKGPPAPRPQSEPRPQQRPQPRPRPRTALDDDDLGDPRALLAESPRRQHERARRRMWLTIAAAVVILAIAIAVAVTVSSS